MNKCPEIQRQNKFICAQMMIIAQALRLIVLHLSVFELGIKDEVNNWWNVGFCWLSSLTAWANDQWEDSETLLWPIRGHLASSQRAAYWPIWCANVVLGWIRPSWVRSTSRHGSLSRKRLWGLRKHYSHSVNKSSVKFYLGNLCLVTLLPDLDASNLCC